MVYESDFYTTRRPYSRPLVSSYSVTSPVVLPLSTLIQLRGGIHHMPYVAHKRLVPVIHTPVHTFYYSGSVIPVRIHSRVRPSILAAEINRIRDLWRPSSISYVERFLNSRDNIYFNDEAREIRARVDSLLRRVHVYIPRASPSDFAEEIIPERMRSDDYIRRLLSGRNNEKKDMEHVSWYEVPERGNFGNLACVKYVAGKPHSIRRPYYKVADLRPSDIKNDVNLLSYYSKNRQAAANASPDEPKTDRELRKARALETEWSEAIAKREAQKAQKAAEEAAKATAEEEEEEETKEKGQRIVEGKVIEKAAQVEEPAKEAAKEAEEPAKEVEQSPKEAEAPSEEAAPAAEPVKKTKAKKDIKKRAVEPPQKEQQPTPEPVKQKEPTPEPVQQKEPTPEPVQQKEPTPEPVQPKEPTPEPVEKEEPAPEAASEAAPEPAQQEEPSVEAAQEQEAPAAEQTARETAEEAEPPTQGEVAEPQESKAEESERAEPVSEEKEQNEEEQSDSGM